MSIETRIKRGLKRIERLQLSPALKNSYRAAFNTACRMQQQQGEEAVITLMKRNTATGKIEAFLPLSEGWMKKRLSQGPGLFTEEFHVAEDLLTLAQSQQVHAVNYNGKTYAISEKVKPQAFDRFWRLQIKPAEA